MRRKPFPDDQRDQADRRKDSQDEDEVRGEPVVLLPTIEHDLKSADAEDQQSDPYVVHSYATRLSGSDQVRGILDQAKDEKKRQQPDGEIDEEDPAPRKVVGNPSAQDGPYGGRDDGGDAVKGKRQPAFLRRKRVGQDGLSQRLQAAPSQAL